MYYTYYTKDGKICYYTDTRLFKKEAFVEILKQKYHQVNASMNAVEKSSEKPKSKPGLRIVYISVKKGVNISQVLQDNPELTDKIREKLSEAGAAEKVVDIICETVSEYCKEISKEELREAMQAESDEEPVGGAVIVYNNYLIIS